MAALLHNADAWLLAFTGSLHVSLTSPGVVRIELGTAGMVNWAATPLRIRQTAS